MQAIWIHFFLGRRWINNQRKSNSVWYNTPHWKIIALILKITKSHLNNRICQHCGMKTSTVTLFFYYVFNIFLPCNINIPSFIGNLWWVLLLGNHLNFERKYCPVKSLVYFLSRCLPGLHNSVTRKNGRKKDIAMFFLDVSSLLWSFPRWYRLLVWNDILLTYVKS